MVKENNETKWVNEEHGIFTDKEVALEGLRKSAEAVGLDPELVAPEAEIEEPPQFYAKESCKRCWGRGVLYYVPSPVKAKNIIGIDGKKKNLPANELSEVWNTCKPEPPGLKNPMGTMVEGPNGEQYMGIGQFVYCHCVRVLDKEDES